MSTTKVSYSMIDDSFVNVKDFGAIGDGSTDATAAIQLAINSLASYQTLFIEENYKLTNSLTITSKSNIRITGGGKLFFSSAPSSAYIFNLVGTIDNLEIDNLTLIGDNNAGSSQYAIGNASGQTISNTRFHDLNISNINVGISHNADTSGSWTNGLCYNNYLENILGTSAGSGYGIFMSKAYNLKVVNNTINNASRHAIYQGRGDNVNLLIEGNIIVNHRKDVYDGSPRMAISCARSSNVTISNNKFLDCYDGQIDVVQDTSSSASVSNILIIGNTFTNRKNNTPAIWIGEQLVPTTAKVFKVSVLNNTFDEDNSVTSGLASTILVLHGAQINIEGNRFRRYSVSSTLNQCVEVGDTRYITSDAHIDDIVVRNNFATSDNAVASSRFSYIVDQLCTGSSKYLIKDNVHEGWASEYYFEATPVNVNSKLKFHQDVVYDLPSIAAGQNSNFTFTITGCKPTSKVTSRMQYSKQVSPIPVYTFGAVDNAVNSAFMCAANTNLTSATNQPSQTFRFFVEDF
tara:strand:- start:4138 stop:5691 length:1554 start_codon:yes stop_codon:yes gene_type:complete